MASPSVVLDTNTFVAAGFNPRSASARIIDEVRRERLRLVWNDATQDEIRHVLNQIPRLSWRLYAPLFRDDARYDAPTDPARHDYVSDPADRKFLALAEAAGAVLVTSDHHLLDHARRLPGIIQTPTQFLNGLHSP